MTDNIYFGRDFEGDLALYNADTWDTTCYETHHLFYRLYTGWGLEMDDTLKIEECLLPWEFLLDDKP